MITIYKDLKEQRFYHYGLNIPQLPLIYLTKSIYGLMLIPPTLYNHLIYKDKIWAIQNLQSTNSIKSIISKAIINNSIINEITLNNPYNQPISYLEQLYKITNEIHSKTTS